MITFEERAQEMGLEVEGYRGMYSYKDKLSEVIYRELYTLAPEDLERHPTDNAQSGYLAVFTKLPDSDNWSYQGIVSRVYRFIGNEALNEVIRHSVKEVGMPIVRENIILSEQLTQMRNEIIISNPVGTEAGDILPVIIVRNSYNGTWAQGMQFGITSSAHEFTFGFNMGQIRQIHVAGAVTTMADEISKYNEIFNESIVPVIQSAFETKLTQDQFLGVLDLIESFGKKRRETISEIFNELTQEGQVHPTVWHIFLAIVRYSSIESNLNAKRLLENAAESVLVVPWQMRDAFERLERGEY